MTESAEGKAPYYYDKMIQNSLHFKKKKGGQHDVGLELDGVIPSAGEIRLLGNRHKQCLYYQIGKVISDNCSYGLKVLKKQRRGIRILYHKCN